MRSKKDFFLYLAIAIPICMIAITAIGVLYYQKMDLRPKYNFLYLMVGPNEFTCQRKIESALFPEYRQSILLAKQAINCDDTHLYIYDFTHHTNTKITLDQASKLSLTAHNQYVSPDGFRIKTYCRYQSLFGWWGNNLSDYGICLTKDDYNKKLNISYDKQKNRAFVFLGWVLGTK